MHRDALTERLMHQPAQDVVQMRFPAEHKCKAVERVIPMVHQHFYVIQYARGQVLRFIDSKKQRLSFFPVKAVYLLLYRFEHAGFSAPVLHAGHGAELAVKLHHADSGETVVFHMVKARIQPGGKTPQGKGPAHAGAGGEYADAAGVF